MFKLWIHLTFMCALNTREDLDCGTESGKNTLEALYISVFLCRHVLLRFCVPAFCVTVGVCTLFLGSAS